MNFANAQQAALGLHISAEDFLKSEWASGTAFSIAASENSREDLTPEFEGKAAAAGSISPEQFEALVKRFLKEVWVEHKDPQEALDAIVAEHSLIAQAVGKAADAIEGRCDCVWGRDDSSCLGYEKLMKEIS